MPKQGSAMKKRAVRGSRTGRPVMALLDLLGRRWSLRIIWELREDRRLTSRALRTACDEASPTILQTRLSELREAGLVELVPGDGYRLTTLGKDLTQTILPLHRFAERWSKRAGGLSRRHRQAGAVGAYDLDAAAGGCIGAGDAPDGVVDPHRARSVDDRFFQREDPADQRVGALVEERIADAGGAVRDGKAPP